MTQEASPIVFISGATSGIGLATAKTMIAHSWRVIGTGLPDDDFAPLRELGEKVLALPADITKAKSIAQTQEQVSAWAGEQGLQGLVNNAGIQVPGVLEMLPLDAIKYQFEVNLFGHIAMTQALLPTLRQGRGRIVNVSSIMGKVAMPVLGAYSMSKHALEAMTDVLRMELRPWGIPVIAVEPGAIATPMTDSMTSLLAQNSAQDDSDSTALYEALTEDMTKALQQQSKQAIPVEKVAQVIATALTSKKPKTRYNTDPAGAGLMLMRRLAPDSIGDTILMRALGLLRKKTP
jgi:NAD(P)-dependent dehydrogenase (short-subunit alcohol dehydrogenase family)